ncbi:MAG TPA: DUF3570 domain-containing protein [Candidatus Eisenbacteria bacterium]|nr:DUF3570 domain-containing protein [Candidatus Eisenbacteria bacterium]
MQLTSPPTSPPALPADPPPRPSSIRRKLSAAACILIASGLPAAARAGAGATTQLDTSLLLYGEQARAKVTEPVVRITRLYSSGQRLSAQLALDVISGASPSGALPSGVISTEVQTRTTPSGNVETIPPPAPDQIPTTTFKDTRVAFDADWTRPLGRFTTTLGGHVSHEKDYQSLGGNAKLSIDVMHRLATITIGGGYNHDQVDPVGGTPVGLTDGSTLLTSDPSKKEVSSALVGISRVLTRRWLVGVAATRAWERGYLTEPYKVLSLLDPTSGLTVGQLTEKRPSTRVRGDIQASSVYHLSRDVLYTSYRYYRDDWSLKSHTIDTKYRHELGGQAYLEPHLRYYTQSAADFYHTALIQGEAIPDYATADYRVGHLQTGTVGATLGFHLFGSPGEWSLRGEYVGQFGESHPNDVTGVQQDFNLFHPLNIATFVAAYSVGF